MAEISNPTTSVVDDIYTDEEREFLIAVEKYKRDNKRPFPTWREVMELFISLGYRRTAPAVDPPVFVKGVKQPKRAYATAYRGVRPDIPIAVRTTKRDGSRND